MCCIWCHQMQHIDVARAAVRRFNAGQSSVRVLRLASDDGTQLLLHI